MSAWPIFDEHVARGGDWEHVTTIRQAIEDELDRQHIAAGRCRPWLHRKWGTLCEYGFTPDFDKIAVAIANVTCQTPELG